MEGARAGRGAGEGLNLNGSQPGGFHETDCASLDAFGAWRGRGRGAGQGKD